MASADRNDYSQAMVQCSKYMFQKDVRCAFRHFSAILGIRTTFFSTEGRPLNIGGDQGDCRYHRMLKEGLKLSDAFHTFATDKRREAALRRDLISYRCPDGMIGATAPIVSGGQLICFVSIGQLRQSRTVPKEIAGPWRKRHGIDDLQKAYEETPLYDQEKIEDILGLLSMLIKYIASQNTVQVSESPIVPLLRYIHNHPEKTLSLQEAATLVHRSVSSLSHLFKKTTGQGFRQFQIGRKLDSADEYFRTAPQLSVAQVALKLGYEDPLYFSKLYKKHRGYPPVRAIERFRTDLAPLQPQLAPAIGF